MTLDPDAELAEAVAAARYHEDKVRLYKAKMYSGGATSAHGLRERERARDGALANLRRLRERRAAITAPPTGD